MRCSKPTKMLRVAAALLLTTNLVAPSWAFTPGTNDQNTTSPVKHVIVIYGENRSFDHLYATWQPKTGESVLNLLSEGILNADGSPGPNFSKAQQFQATENDTFRIAPTKSGPYPPCRRRVSAVRWPTVPPRRRSTPLPRPPRTPRRCCRATSSYSPRARPVSNQAVSIPAF